MCEVLILSVIFPFALDWEKEYPTGLECIKQSVAVSSYMETLSPQPHYFLFCAPCDGSESSDGATRF